MSQPLVDHTKLLALDVELEPNPIGGPLNIAQNQDRRKNEQIFHKNLFMIVITQTYVRNGHTRFQIVQKFKKMKINTNKNLK